MHYHAIFFTDVSSHRLHVKSLGAFRLASELRSHGYNVLVIDYFSNWLTDFKDLMTLVKSTISDQTLMVGYSGTFFRAPTTDTSSDYKKNHRQNAKTYGRGKWPDDIKKIQYLNRKIKSINPNLKILYGGAQANNINDELTGCGIDYIVQGFADATIIDIVKSIEQGKTVKFSTIVDGVKVINYDAKGLNFDFRNCSNTTFTADDFVLPNESLPIETSRGCMFKCTFCSFPLLGRNKTDLNYIKDPAILAEELRYNYENFGTTNYSIVDDTFNETTDKLLAVQSAIKQSGVDIRFFSYLRADILARFPEQVDILLDMGLMSALFGIETLNWESAKSIGKGLHPDKIKDFLIKFKRQAGTQVITNGSFILGLPHDTEETLEEDMQWIFDHSDALDSYHLTPLYVEKGDVWSSEIGLNPEKFGYTVDESGRYWTNQHMTFDRAKEIADNWSEKSWHADRQKLGAMAILGLLNLDYKFDYIYNSSINRLPRAEISQRQHSQWQQYKQLVIEKLFK
jgi:hypothetical protein